MTIRIELQQMQSDKSFITTSACYSKPNIAYTIIKEQFNEPKETWKKLVENNILQIHKRKNEFICIYIL